MTLDDLRALGYDVDQDDDVVAVRGYGVAISVNVAEHPEQLAALADPTAHAERRFQSTQPDAHRARRRLLALGYTVDRVDPTSDTFTVKPPPLQPTLPVPAGPVTPRQLLAFARNL